MRIKITVFVFLIAIFSTVLFSTLALGQTSIGYSNPSDISNLLDYRLPKWSYRTWNANFSLDGSGQEARFRGEQNVSNRFTTAMGSTYHQAWESEQRLMELGLALDGAYSKLHTGDDMREYKSRNVRAEYYLSASVEHYLGNSPFHGSVSGYTRRDYSETTLDDRVGDVWRDDTRILRSSRHYIFTGLGYGHLRNVVPLLRAQRLSERLVAMGRPALSGQQIQTIAQILATQYGYRAVFDRYDRHFWNDILTPMLEADNPLTPFEIFYLTDVMNEEIGNRQQGLKVSAGFSYYESSTTGRFEPDTYFSRTPTIELHWYHNLSLASQVYFTGQYRYLSDDTNDEYRERGTLYLLTGYYWNIADRYSLDTTLSYYKRSDIVPERRLTAIDMGSTLRMYLEDKLSLDTGIKLSYDHESEGEQESFSWRWVYTVGLVYHLDRALF